MASKNVSASRHFYERNQDLLPALYGVLAMLTGAGAGVLVMGVASPLGLLVIVLGVAVLIATVVRIDWGLLVVIFIIYTRLSDVAVKYHGVPDVAKSFILVLAIAMAARWILYSNERPHGWGRPALVIALFGMVGFASLFYASDFTEAQAAAVEFFKDGVVAVIITMLLQRGLMFRRIIWTLLAAGILLGTLSVYQYLTGTFDNTYGGFAQAPVQNIVGATNDHRAAGPIGDPNYYAQMMLVLVPLALDRLWNERRRPLRLIALWALAVCSLAIILTFSRGGFVSLVVMLVVMVIYRRQQLANWLPALAVGLVLLQFVPSTYTDRMQTLVKVIPGYRSGTTVRQDAALRGRASELLIATQMFYDYPLLGVGLGNYSVRYQEYSRRLGMDPRAEPRDAHNLYLEIAAETGLLGLAAFGLLLWVMFRGIWEARKALLAAGLTAYADMISAYAFGLIGYMTAALFIHAAYPRYFWVLAGIALAIPRVAEQEVAGLIGEDAKTSPEEQYRPTPYGDHSL